MHHLNPRPKNAHSASREEFMAIVGLFVALKSMTGRLMQEAGDNPLESPVPISEFRWWRHGEEIARWMLYYAYIEHHRRVLTTAENERPLLVSTMSTLFTDASCFTITATGEDYANDLFEDLFSGGNTVQRARRRLLLGVLVPAFSAREHLFSWGRHIVKRFLQPSPNQELVLTAAEELDWPLWFDDPLPRNRGINPKVRLHDTIKKLNQRQAAPVIQFQGQGYGTQVCWRLR